MLIARTLLGAGMVFLVLQAEPDLGFGAAPAPQTPVLADEAQNIAPRGALWTAFRRVRQDLRVAEAARTHGRQPDPSGLPHWLTDRTP